MSDWRKHGSMASTETWAILAKCRQKAAGNQPLLNQDKPAKTWTDHQQAKTAPKRPAAVATAAAVKAGASLRDQAAAARAAKGSRLDRLNRLDAKADKLFKERESRGLQDKSRNVAFDRSVNVSRTLFKEQKRQAAAGKVRGTADRSKRAAEIRAELAKKRKAAEPPPAPAPTPAPKPQTVVKVVTRTPKPSRPGDIGYLPAKSLNVDPDRFQYKLAPGAGGMTGSLTGVKKWDPELAGVVQVWKDPANGKMYVVNGHNRAHLAQQLGVDRLAVRVISAKNADEARAKGALTNIAEGRGNAMDAAKFFRDTGITRADLEAKGVPLKEKIATDGLALSRLETSLFKKVVNGDMPHERAVIIGSSGLDHTEQRALSDLIDKQPKNMPIKNDTLRELVDTVKTSTRSTKTTAGLFGDDVEETNLAIFRADIQAHVKRRLSQEKKLFGIVSKTKAAADLQRGGNVIDTEQSGAISKEAAQALDVFDRLKKLRGPVSDALNDAAEQLHKGAKAKKVQDETYRRILEEIPKAFNFS